MAENSDYRRDVANVIQESEKAYDGGIQYLSAGALALSLVFVKNVIGANEIQYKWFLVIAWICWGLSLLSIFASYRSSRKAHWTVLNQLKKKRDNEEWGGIYNKITDYLNCTTGILFAAGFAFMIVFATCNLEDRTMSTDQESGEGTNQSNSENTPAPPRVEIRGQTVIPPEEPPPPPEDSGKGSAESSSSSDETE